jgi:hypothetical protein
MGKALIIFPPTGMEVLQRIDTHPAFDVYLLTPRL